MVLMGNHVQHCLNISNRILDIKNLTQNLCDPYALQITQTIEYLPFQSQDADCNIRQGEFMAIKT